MNIFTLGVINQLYGVAACAGGPVTKPKLTADLKAINDALALVPGGGSGVVDLKNAALTVVIDDLRAMAAFVDTKQGNDRALLLSSGFKAASTNRAQSPLPQAVITKITLAGPGRLLVEGDVMNNVKSWEGQWKPEGAPDSAYQHAKNLGADRKMTVTDLPALTRVTLQMRGIGGSTGYGEWSDGVTHPVV